MMMEFLTINAPAKLNFLLDIVGVRNGYHLMEMIMQTINLYDIITVKKNAGSEITITGSYPDVRFDETNIAHKVAAAFFNQTGIDNCGVEILIEKSIPVGAGLGGGSADGAAVLKALNTLFGANLCLQEMIAIGAKIGADIPYCLVGGTALVTGIGECVSPMKLMPECTILLCKPTVSIMTSEAFKAYDSTEICHRPNIAKMRNAIESGDIYAVATAMGNVFEEVIKRDEIEYVKQGMQKFGALRPMMTGSGSAVFSIFGDPEKANECKKWLNKAQLQAFVCKCI